MIRLLIADDEALERETLADIVARRFEHEVTIETAENGRKAEGRHGGHDLCRQRPGLPGGDADAGQQPRHLPHDARRRKLNPEP